MMPKIYKLTIKLRNATQQLNNLLKIKKIISTDITDNDIKYLKSKISKLNKEIDKRNVK